MTRERDIYGRRPVSRSRGKTQQRIMDLQHDPATLPGGETLLADAPAGSIAAALVAFHQEWVSSQPVTSRRAYERSLVFLARDLDEGGDPPLTAPLADLTVARLEGHLGWRVRKGLDHPGELQRAGVHLGRLAEWLDSEQRTAFGAARDRLRDAATALAPSDRPAS